MKNSENTQSQIERLLRANFAPWHCEVLNESHMHNVPKGSESHFKIILVSENFMGLAALARHRQVQAFISNKVFPKLHALSLKLYTPEEWKNIHPTDLISPPCLGGSKT